MHLIFISLLSLVSSLSFGDRYKIEQLFKRGTTCTLNLPTIRDQPHENLSQFTSSLHADFLQLIEAPLGCPNGKLNKRVDFTKCFSTVKNLAYRPLYISYGTKLGYPQTFLNAASTDILFQISKEYEIFDQIQNCNINDDNFYLALRAIHELDHHFVPLTKETMTQMVSHRLGLIQKVAALNPQPDLQLFKEKYTTSTLEDLTANIVTEGGITFFNFNAFQRSYTLQAFQLAKQMVQAALDIKDSLKDYHYFDKALSETEVNVILHDILALPHLFLANVADNNIVGPGNIAFVASFNGNVHDKLVVNINYNTKAYYNDGVEEAARTLVHEISHLYGTEDHEYGQACLQLAKNNPHDAMNNADSFALFASYCYDVKRKLCPN